MIEQNYANHTKHIKQLNRISGQVNGIIKMIHEERYCIDILTQFKAIRSSLASIEKKIFNEHLNHCVHKALKSNNKTKVDIVLNEIQQLLKSAKL